MNKIDYYEILGTSNSNDSSKKSIFEVCEDIMIFLVLYPIMSNVLGVIYKNNLIIIQGLVLIIYTILLTLIRTKFKNPFLGIVLSLILCCVFIAIPFSNYERFICGIYIILMLITSITKFFSRNFTFYNRLSLALGEALLWLNLLFAYGLDNISLVKYLTLFSALAFSLIFLFYLSRSRLRLLINTKKEPLYNKTIDLSIKKFIIFLFSAFFVFMCFILLITSRINSNTNYALTHALSSIFMPIDHQSPNKNNASITEHNPPRIHVNTNTKIRGTNYFYKDHFGTYYTIVALILVVFLLFIIFKVIKLVLTLKIDNQETEEGESTFLKEDLKKDLHNIVPNFTFNLSNKEKLRKYYKKLIKRYRKKGLSIKTSSTSRELKDGILNLTGDDIKDITKIYNKARYSLYEPTENDIDKLKKMWSNNASHFFKLQLNNFSYTVS